MPLSSAGFEAWIEVEGNESRCYKMEDLDDSEGQTCWIASELDKAFSIHWQNHDAFLQTAGRVWVDGVECSGEILQGPGKTSVSGRRTSGTTVAPFIFSSMNLTDDDAFLDTAPHQDLGLIKVEIWAISYTGQKKAFPVASAPSQSKIHERSKKSGAHQTKFGNPVTDVARGAAVVEYLELTPLATFAFIYRSLDLLQANGIAPKFKSVLGKRPASTAPSGSSKPDIKNLKRVKQEESVPSKFKPGEIIDLTRSETPEIIDLT